MDNESSKAEEEIRRAMSPNPASGWIRGIIGAIVGGAIGFVLFKWLWSQGFYAGMLPGGFIGAGFGIGAARQMGWAAAIACAIVALVFGCWADAATNETAQTLMEYVGDYARIPDINKIMIALGTLASGWFARGR